MFRSYVLVCIMLLPSPLLLVCFSTFPATTSSFYNSLSKETIMYSKGIHEHTNSPVGKRITNYTSWVSLRTSSTTNVHRREGERTTTFMWIDVFVAGGEQVELNSCTMFQGLKETDKWTQTCGNRSKICQEPDFLSAEWKQKNRRRRSF